MTLQYFFLSENKAHIGLPNLSYICFDLDEIVFSDASTKTLKLSFNIPVPVFEFNYHGVNIMVIGSNPWFFIFTQPHCSQAKSILDLQITWYVYFRTGLNYFFLLQSNDKDLEVADLWKRHRKTVRSPSPSNAFKCWRIKSNLKSAESKNAINASKLAISSKDRSEEEMSFLKFLAIVSFVCKTILFLNALHSLIYSLKSQNTFLSTT